MIAIQLQCYMYAQEGVSPQLNTISVSSIHNSMGSSFNINLFKKRYLYFWINRDISISNRDISNFNRDISIKIRDISI